MLKPFGKKLVAVQDDYLLVGGKYVCHRPGHFTAVRVHKECIEEIDNRKYKDYPIQARDLDKFMNINAT